jgi:hypothetical protein
MILPEGKTLTLKFECSLEAGGKRRRLRDSQKRSPSIVTRAEAFKVRFKRNIFYENLEGLGNKNIKIREFAVIAMKIVRARS